MCVSLAFEITSCIDAFYSKDVSCIYYAIAASSKFIFISLFSYFMLKKRFTLLQKLGLTVIFLIIFYDACSIINKKNNGFDKNTAYSFIAIILSGFISSLSNIYFEKYVKYNILDFYTYTLDYARMHIFVSMVTASIEIMLFKDINSAKNTICNYKFSCIVFISVMHTYIIAYSSVKINPIGRSFLGLLAGNITTIILDYTDNKNIDKKPLISLIIVNIGIIMYKMEKIKKLAKVWNK